VTRSHRRIAGALLIALTVALSGCGGDDRKEDNAYVDKVNRIQTKFASAYKRVASEITSTTSPKQDQKTIGQLQTTIDETVADLRSVKPPAKVEKLHNDLVIVLDDYGTKLGGVSDDLLSRNQERSTRAVNQLASDTSDASADFTRAIDDINSTLHN
jgi:hypothetical protein